MALPAQTPYNPRRFSLTEAPFPHTQGVPMKNLVKNTLVGITLTAMTTGAIAATKSDELAEKIGTEYGNTPTNKVVEVTINNQGQINVKDLSKGNQVIDFHMIAATKKVANAGDLTAANINAASNVFNNITNLTTKAISCFLHFIFNNRRSYISFVVYPTFNTTSFCS